MSPTESLPVSEQCKKMYSDVLPHFGFSIRMRMNIVFPSNLRIRGFFTHSNIENTYTVGNVSVENR